MPQIAKDLHVHRHSVGKLYRNQVTHPSLQLLDRICNWLIERGVPPHVLPQQLFGLQTMQVWEAMTALGTVTFYLGEYQQETGAPTHGLRWISRRDSGTASALVEHLSAMNSLRKTSLQFHTAYISFRALADTGNSQEDILKEDIASSRKVFEQMRAQSAGKTPLLIGSQRVNYLLEHLVADLFDCQPFLAGGSGPYPVLREVPADRLGRRVASEAWRACHPSNDSGIYS